ncbi:spirocyclase AveC family protein [Kitasatospora sp. NPDC097605]|uniref:spirocyclase AveC family protein n=1 Tax=Kitasatospora sp. NPDC097605 TaxID=3157226 RepID=UPI00332FDFBA
MSRSPALSATAATTRRLRTTPAFRWALTGTVFTAAGAWVLTGWAVAGVTSPAYGGDSISGARHTAVVAAQVLLATVLAGCAVHLIRSSLRCGQVTLSAGITLGFLLSSWQSPLLNYHNVTMVVNRHLVHVNSWGPYIPGWHPPRPEAQIEAPLTTTGVGFGLLILCVWAQAVFGLKLVERFPRWRPPRVLAAVIGLGIVTDILLEAALINTGVFSYAHAWRPATLFAGHWYNIPLSAPFTATAVTTPFAVMWILERTRGTVPRIYRGAELASTATRQNVVRALAGVGAGNLALLVYLALNVLCGLIGGPQPGDTPSYMWPAGTGWPQ